MKYALLICLTVTTSVAITRAEDAPKPVRGALKVPQDFPAKLPTIVVGRLEGPTPKQTAWVFDRAGQGEHVAQTEAGTNRLWFARTIDEDARGKVTPIAVLPALSRSIVRIVERSEGFQFLNEGRPVLFYQRRPKSQDGKYTRANYVHPLLGFDGEELTQDFPVDHRHHRGVFWAWHQLWVGELRAGDPWINEDFEYHVRKADVVEEGPVFATLAVDVDWVSPKIVDEAGKPRPIVRENTTIRLFDRVGDAQYVDFEIRLRPLLEGVRIGGSENERGYSGFTVRVKPPGDMQLRDEAGVLTEDGVNRASRWVDVSGNVNGKSEVSGVGILSHRTLPEFPPKWLLRRYGMQNAAYPGQHAVKLSAEKPLVLRHRLVIHRGDAAAARIADHQRVYELTEFASATHRESQ